MVAFKATPQQCQKIESLVTSITTPYFGIESYATAELKAVAYLYLIIKNHPFTDGNKRTASLVFATVCEINDLVPQYQDSTLDELAVFIGKVQEPDHHRTITEIANELFGSQT